MLLQKTICLLFFFSSVFNHDKCERIWFLLIHAELPVTCVSLIFFSSGRNNRSSKNFSVKNCFVKLLVISLNLIDSWRKRKICSLKVSLKRLFAITPQGTTGNVSLRFLSKALLNGSQLSEGLAMSRPRSWLSSRDSTYLEHIIFLILVQDIFLTFHAFKIKRKLNCHFLMLFS